MLYEKLEKSFSVNNKAKSTLSNYTRCLAHIALHTKQSPEKLNKESINDYLYFCKNLHKTPSESFFKHTIFGLRAAYKVLDLEDKGIKLPEIKAQNKLPVVLSKEEVRRFISIPKYLRHRLIIATLYGCGLRSYELCSLKLSDVDFDRMTVFVKQQKGNTDRYVPLSKHLARGLKKYINTEHPIDYLFNSQVTKDGNPQGITVRAIQWVVKENRSKIGSSKKMVPYNC